MSVINVIDSIMGSGKTSWAIEYIRKHKDSKRFIYVTPYLKEIQERIVPQLPHLIEPNEKAGKGSKQRHLRQLLREGQDVITTHALFERIGTEEAEIIKDMGYTLILDEVFNVINKMNITRDDVEGLINSGRMRVENDSRITWLKNDYKGEFEHLMHHAKNGNAYSHDGSVVFWTFPAKMFTAFEDVYVLTYLFNGQIQRYYYDFHNVQYRYKAVEKRGEQFVLTSYDPLKENRKKYADLINIYEGKKDSKTNLNTNYVEVATAGRKGKTPNERYFLSWSWFRDYKDHDVMDRLQKNLYTYFNSVCKAKAGDIIWTCLKDYKSDLKGKGYTNGYIPLNARATNDYKDTHNLAYVFNRFMKPDESKFFSKAGIKVDQDLLAVSDLLQWIWRSAVRNNPAEPINVYLPSERMRTLLKQWINGEI